MMDKRPNGDFASMSSPHQDDEKEALNVIRGWLVQEALSLDNYSSGKNESKWKKLAKGMISGDDDRVFCKVIETIKSKPIIEPLENEGYKNSKCKAREPADRYVVVVLSSILQADFEQIIQNLMQKFTNVTARSGNRGGNEDGNSDKTGEEIPLLYMRAKLTEGPKYQTDISECVLTVNPVLFIVRALDRKVREEKKYNFLRDKVFDDLMAIVSNRRAVWSDNDITNALRTKVRENRQDKIGPFVLTSNPDDVQVFLSEFWKEQFPSIFAAKTIKNIPVAFYYITPSSGPKITADFMPWFCASSLQYFLNQYEREKGKPHTRERMSQPLRHYMGIGIGRTRRWDALDERNRDKLNDLKSDQKSSPACWPGKYGLNAMQKVCVNAVHNRISPIIAVNGPPGTGKTTLLRDVVADVVFGRARRLSSIENPHIDSNTGQTPCGFSLDCLLEYSAILASSNNSAIENITREIPLVKAISQEEDTVRFMQMPSYPWCDIRAENTFMKRLAGGLLDKRGKTAEDDPDKQSYGEVSTSDLPNAWGLIVAEAGRLANREYVNAILENGPCNDSVDSLPAILMAREEYSRKHPGHYDQCVLPWWNQIREEFENALDAFNRLVGIVTIDDKQGQENIARQAKDDSREPAGINPKAQKAKDDCRSLERKLKKALKTPRPSFLFFWRRKPYDQNIETIKNALKKARAAKQFYDKQQHDEKIAPKCVPELPKPIPIVASADPQAVSLARKRVFWASYKLCHAFAYINLDVIVDNLGFNENDEAISEQTEIPYPDDETAESIDIDLDSQEPDEDLSECAVGPASGRWSGLFALLPLISTTFASFKEQEKFGKAGVGLAMIDEAGMATPQTAVNLLMCVKSAVVVGDPLQCEPIYSMTRTAMDLALRVINPNAVDTKQWIAPESVQTRADTASVIYGKRWHEGNRNTKSRKTRPTGIPLEEHHRCPENIFNAINKVVYNNSMIFRRNKDAEANVFHEIKSGWLSDDKDSNKASRCGGRISKRDDGGGKGRKEIGIVSGKIKEIIREAAPQKRRTNVRRKIEIFLISPFRDMADAIRNESICRKGVRWNSEDANNFDIHVESGTIHSFQGKQADFVFLILPDTPKEQVGKILWVTNNINLINVAATRATKGFFVVGDQSIWRKNEMENVMNRIEGIQ